MDSGATCWSCELALESLLYAGQKLSFGLYGPIIVDQHNLIVENAVQSVAVAQLVGLVPGLLQCNNF